MNPNWLGIISVVLAIGYSIPVLGREGERYIIGDPLRGREVLSLGELHERYEFTEFHMRVKR